MENLDSARLNFDQDSMLILNICLAIVMFGVALSLNFTDFRRILSAPRPVLVGLSAQFILLPALTYLLIITLRPGGSLALGLMLVAACPGGNVSNFITQMAGGNTALSVSLTAFSSLLCLFFTPFNLAFWGKLYAPSRELLQSVSLQPAEVFYTIIFILALPLLAGIGVHQRFPAIALRLGYFLRPLSLLILLAIIAIAFINNRQIFVSFFQTILLLVFLHNAIALGAGLIWAKAWKLPPPDQRSIAIETGIQNSALGLVLIFGFFNGLGGMAIIAGWWGIWHIVAGLSLAFYWKRTKAQTLQG